MLRATPEVHEKLRSDDPATAAALPALGLLSAGFEVRQFCTLEEGVWLALVRPDAGLHSQFGLTQDCLVTGTSLDFDQKVLRVPAPPDWGAIDGRVRLLVARDSAAEAGATAWGAGRGMNVVVVRAPLGADTDHVEHRAVLTERLARFLWRRDLFDEVGTAGKDHDFFGRSAEVGWLLSRVSAGAPSAILGLRKIGKSSLLEHLRSVLCSDTESTVITAQISGDSGRVRRSRWWTVAQDVISVWTDNLRQLADDTGSRIRPHVSEFKDAIHRRIIDQQRLASALEKDVLALCKTANALRRELRRSRARAVILFDDCEGTFPHLSGADQWRSDFFAFWDVFQNVKKRLDDPADMVFVLACSDPSGVERGTLLGRANPLFGTTSLYLGPVTAAETADLLNGIGSKIGLHFESSAADVIAENIGGHPLLLRRFGSAIHRMEGDRTQTSIVDASKVKQCLRKQKRELLNQMAWVLDHLRRVEPDEDRLLRDLSISGPQAYSGAWKNDDLRDALASRLEQYGLVRFVDETPFVCMPLVKDVMRRPAANEFGEQKAQLKVLVDDIESAVRYRLEADIGGDSTPTEAVHSIVAAIPGDARNRPLARHELIVLGETHGIGAILEAMNWGDYEILLDRFYGTLRWSAPELQKADRLSLVKTVFAQAHLVRHNNDRELRQLIADEGFARVYGRLSSVRDMLVAQGVI